MKKGEKAVLLRKISLVGFFVYTAWMAYMHQLRGGGPYGYPSMCALCPFGGLETLHLWLSEGAFLRRVAPSAIVLFASVSIMTFFLRRVFCGWICPLGAIGEFCSFVGRKCRLPRIDLPEHADRYLKFIKYGILIGIIWGTITTRTLIWRDFDPWIAWAHVTDDWNDVVQRPWAWSVFLVSVVGASLFIERFWCRYLCPLGATLGILGKISPLKVGGSGIGCTNCALCRKACPIQLHPEKGNVSGAECLACGRCVVVASERCDVRFRFAGKNASVLTIGIITLLFFFVSYSTARALGFWQTSVPIRATASMNPDRIAESVFGWMNLRQVSEATGIPAEEIRRRAELEDISEEEPIRNLGIDYKIRDAVRDIAKDRYEGRH
jgi:polyferredoxin